MMLNAGFVLTGGLSSRMGRDKALLPAGSQTLCEHIADVLSVVAQHVMLVGHPERYGHLKYRCLADVRPGLGPLSGLETALSLELAEFCVIASCDAYNLDAAWLRALLAESRRSGALCTVARDSSGKLQPLCAVYRKECRPLVSSALSAGRLRVMDLLKELGAVAVTIPGTVLNLNTPEEYQELLNAGTE
jgi:molybdopterin-guanine dinucleotide biosynthesis protein A